MQTYGVSVSVNNAAAVAQDPRCFRFGAFHIDLEQRELFRDGSRIRVQAKVCDALVILIENAGEIVTRETLRARLWPMETQINYDANVNTTVNKLRQVLGDSSDRPAYVETIPRRGYTFIANLEAIERPPLGGSSREAAVRQSQDQVSILGSLMMRRSSPWFAAGTIALLIAGMLFGAALMLYAHRAV